MKIMMKRMTTIPVFLLLLTGLFLPSISRAVPYYMNFQGTLSDSAGAAVPDGPYTMIFRIYDDAASVDVVNLLWEETQTVTVTGGIYNVLLGAGTTNPAYGSFAPSLFTGDDRWLEITVNGETLAPRQKIASVAYSMQADYAFTAGITGEADTLDGFHAWELDQRSHVADTGNPHNVTAAQVGAATTGALAAHEGNPSAHHSRYTDTEAVGAMGAKNSGNPLNHNRFTALEAVAAVKNYDGHGSNIDADSVDTIHASSTPTAGRLLSLDGSGKFPNTVLYTGSGNGLDADLLDGLEANDIINAASGGASNPIASCGTVITASGAYALTKDLDASAGGTCIDVQADDVTLDLMGFSINGPGTSTTNSYGIYLHGNSNVEIRNGTIRGIGFRGIYETNPAGNHHRIINVRVLGSGNTGIYLSGDGHLIKGCTIAGSGSNGIAIYGNSGTVTGCTITGNGGTGIEVGNGFLVTGNVSSANTGVGIDTGSGASVVGNTAKDSLTGAGISVGDRSLVDGNTVTGNGFNGIVVSDSCQVVRNTVSGNTESGILVISNGFVKKNIVTYNSKSGIQAGSGSMIEGNSLILNNSVGSSTEGGITVGFDSNIGNNHIMGNSKNGIYVSGNQNVLHENTIANSDKGIVFTTTGNYYAGNRVSGFTTAAFDLGTTTQTDGGNNVGF